MIDVRVDRRDLLAILRPNGRVLDWLLERGLTRIDLDPPAAGPEAELTFRGDEDHADAVGRDLRGAMLVRRGQPPAALTVLAIRHRPDDGPG